jgi:hypothetical protein
MILWMSVTMVDSLSSLSIVWGLFDIYSLTEAEMWFWKLRYSDIPEPWIEINKSLRWCRYINLVTYKPINNIILSFFIHYLQFIRLGFKMQRFSKELWQWLNHYAWLCRIMSIVWVYSICTTFHDLPFSRLQLTDYHYTDSFNRFYFRC